MQPAHSRHSPQVEGLSGGQEYLVKVAACSRQHCGSVMELSCRTRPSVPSLQGSVSLVAASDTTLTILLPLLTNPPGCVCVCVCVCVCYQ